MTYFESPLIIGAAGHGMAPLTRYCLTGGQRVAVHDRSPDQMAPLIEMGATVVGAEDEIPNWVDGVVYSSAVPPTHPLLSQAHSFDVPTATRAEWMSGLRADRVVAVAGSHGKTSTAWLLVQMLDQLGGDPSYIIGGRGADGRILGRRSSTDAVLVLEVDDSDGSILGVEPTDVALLNFDPDICSVPDMDTTSIFRTWIEGIVNARIVVPEALKLEGDVGVALLEQADHVVRAASVDTERLPEFPKRIRQNAGVAEHIALDVTSGGSIDYRGLSLPEGRSTTLRPARGPVRAVVRDSADHPVEIAAALADLDDEYPGSPVLLIQQVGRFSRALKFASEYRDTLSSVEKVYLTPIDAKGETPPAGMSAADVATRLLPRFGELLAEGVDPFDSPQAGQVIALFGDGPDTRRWYSRVTSLFG